jgi:hypothetical protein
MYHDAHISDIRRVDNAKAKGQAKSDKTPIDQCFMAIVITPISICWSDLIIEMRSEGH